MRTLMKALGAGLLGPTWGLIFPFIAPASTSYLERGVVFVLCLAVILYLRSFYKGQDEYLLSSFKGQEEEASKEV